MTQTTGRTARTLTPKGARTRARIVDAAAELVSTHGVQRTGVDDVQQAARVSASQLYHYFAGKDDLVRAVIARQADAVVGAQLPLLDELDSFEALARWADLLVSMQEERRCVGGCPLGSLAAEVAETDSRAREALADGFDRWEQPIRNGLARMRERGELRPDTDTEELALALLTSVQGGLVLTQVKRSTAPLRAALAVALDQVDAKATVARSRTSSSGQ